MMDYFYQYPILKWILAGFGVLYLLDKYAGFSPIDTLINSIGKYQFKMFSDLNNPRLKQLSADYNNKAFAKVESDLLAMPNSYRAFGLKCLGQYGKTEISDEWMKTEPTKALPKLIRSYQYIHKAWEIRGRDTIDMISDSDLKSFKEYLKKAEVLLVGISKSKNEFQLNIASSLLKIYKAIDVERSQIHTIYNEAIKINPNDAELHFNYFATISPKWGGTEEELNTYLNDLNTRSPFIQDLITAQHYADLVYFDISKDKDGEMQDFMNRIKTTQIDEDELYKYELYLLLYWLAHNLKLKDLKNHYKALIEPFWED